MLSFRENGMVWAKTISPCIHFKWISIGEIIETQTNLLWTYNVLCHKIGLLLLQKVTSCRQYMHYHKFNIWVLEKFPFVIINCWWWSQMLSNAKFSCISSLRQNTFLASGCRWKCKFWLVTANGLSPCSKITARHFTWKRPQDAARRCSCNAGHVGVRWMRSLNCRPT